MRLLLAAAILASIVSAPVMAQSCETISVRNAAGQVTSSKEICVDVNGDWIDPAAVIQGSVQAATGKVFMQNPREILAKPSETVWQPTPLPEAVPLPPSPAIQLAPLVQPEPYPTEYVEVEPTQTEIQIAPVAPVEATDRGSQPTSGKTQREDVYAKLGLVCVARQAMFCGVNDCTGLCTGNTGWCDGKTGETYASLEAIERVYCRKIKRR